MSRPIVTLLTDFGLQDTFVGQMKGVLHSYCPEVSIVDLTHNVSPQSIREASLHLSAAWRSFPAGTVHLAVVDPGVGTERRAIALRYQGHLFVLPDNGLVTGVLGKHEPDTVVDLARAQSGQASISRTFHGRDVFAPVAGQLAAGMPLERAGQMVDQSTVVRLDLPLAVIRHGVIEGEVVLIDRFGNAITNIASVNLVGDPAAIQVYFGNHRLQGLSRTYQDATPGSALALISSMDTLEIAVCNGSASETLGLRTGTNVSVQMHTSQQSP